MQFHCPSSLQAPESAPTVDPEPELEPEPEPEPELLDDGVGELAGELAAGGETVEVVVVNTIELIASVLTGVEAEVTAGGVVDGVADDPAG